jgi:phosphatidylinositol alpha-mannosyltransferase
MKLLPSNFRLWVASDGPELSRLESLYADDKRIEWLGRITDDEKIRRLNRATFFCAPSLGGESFGLVLLEAMAAGACLVASDIDGYRQVARHDQDGWLVPSRDPHALADSFVTLWNDEISRRRLVTSGYERAARFSMESLANEYVQIYERLLEDEAMHRLELNTSRLVRRFNDRLLRRPRAAS